MDKNIVNFHNIVAGWMDMEIYDHRTDESRFMRISYLQNFFNDLLMACKFLLSDITGIYEIAIDQEGFDANIRFYKYNDKTITLEINEDAFEDEKDEEGHYPEEYAPDCITYFNVNIKEFIINILHLIDSNKKDYNEGFALCPAEMVDEETEGIVKFILTNKNFGDDENEKISNT